MLSLSLSKDETLTAACVDDWMRNKKAKSWIDTKTVDTNKKLWNADLNFNNTNDDRSIFILLVRLFLYRSMTNVKSM